MGETKNVTVISFVGILTAVLSPIEMTGQVVDGDKFIIEVKRDIDTQIKK